MPRTLRQFSIMTCDNGYRFPSDRLVHAAHQAVSFVFPSPILVFASQQQSWSVLLGFVSSIYSDIKEVRSATASPATIPRHHALHCLISSVMQLPPKDTPKEKRGVTLIVKDCVAIERQSDDRLVLSWVASPLSDMVADSLVALVSQAEVSPASIRSE